MSVSHDPSEIILYSVFQYADLLLSKYLLLLLLFLTVILLDIFVEIFLLVFFFSGFIDE